MGFLFPSPSMPPPPPPPVFKPDPELAAQREAAKSRADATASQTADASSSSTIGRLMGTQGGRALFTNTAAGFGRTLGNANV